jgi:hypothetical protein
MQTIIMTVGTSLLTNPDKNLEPQRPWLGQKTIGDPQRALAWMKEADLELISAETNTYLRLDPTSNDALILLHSETPDGLEGSATLWFFGNCQVSINSTSPKGSDSPPHYNPYPERDPGA